MKSWRRQNQHQIDNLTTTRAVENIADSAVELWEKLAYQVILIVGEDGFNSLYTRSVLIAKRDYPWLSSRSFPVKTGQQFSELKLSLETRTPDQASAANRLLLVTFTDTLALLIGEQLTASLLRSAWNADSLNGHKDLNNER